ncbi:MipA/OmpV family protein [Catenovulum sp. SM1970]|uniref:MipA/OmpV family protein n=1 Tax=Marinifaba aquimaris TaxID=2741323 RepID=UPI001571606E|nr:MipA/OmpV family protein [Marinifaba aquimaris]NTS78087.1 MipA/OmpV family protein [Marinifaba aquimaris]
MKRFSAITAASLLAFSGASYANVDEIPDVETDKGSGFHGIVGLGAMNAPEYVGGSENETIAVPLINVNYNDTFYFKFNRAGWKFWKPSEKFFLGLELGRRAGWEKEDLESSFDNIENISSPQLEERDAIVLAGINAGYKSGRFNAEISILGGSADENVNDVEPGGEVVVRASYTFIANEKFTLSAAAKVESLSEDTVEYLYGTPTYKGDSTTNATIALVGTYNLNKSWVIMAAAGGTSLGDEIADSPLVADDSQSIALLGAAYKF